MWQKIKKWYTEHGKELSMELLRWLTVVLVICCLAFALYAFWREATKEPVSSMSQKQAETPLGAKAAADNANAKIDSSQAEEITSTIREIRITEKEPTYIIQTTGSEARAVAEKAQEQAEADFAIVTDKDNPDEEVELVKLPDDATVNLNQYNIQAFKKQFNTIEYQPTEKVVGYTHQWKVTDSGRYMGVGVDYDLDDKKVYAKITYSW